MSFASAVDAKVGAWALIRLTGPEDVWSRRDRIRFVSSAGGAMDPNNLFLTANPTPCSLTSSDGLPCQNRVKSTVHKRKYVMCLLLRKGAAHRLGTIQGFPTRVVYLYYITMLEILFFLKKDRPDHHGIDGLKVRDVEKGCGRRAFLRGRQQSVFNHTNWGHLLLYPPPPPPPSPRPESLMFIF